MGWVIIIMATVDADGSCQFSSDSQPKSAGLIWALAATRHSSYIHQVNQVTSCNDFDHDDSTIKIVVVIIITVIWQKSLSWTFLQSKVGETTSRRWVICSSTSCEEVCHGKVSKRTRWKSDIRRLVIPSAQRPSKFSVKIRPVCIFMCWSLQWYELQIVMEFSLLGDMMTDITEHSIRCSRWICM